jgi:hypothetical protein
MRCLEPIARLASRARLAPGLPRPGPVPAPRRSSATPRLGHHDPAERTMKGSTGIFRGSHWRIKDPKPRGER